MEIWFSAIGDFGFPAAISFYLLHRIEQKLDTLNNSVHSLKSRYSDVKRSDSASYLISEMKEENDLYQ